MSPTPVVAAAGPSASNPQGARHRRLNSGGGRCWTCCQHPPGPHHRRLQLRWWQLPDLPPATPRGPAIDISNSGGGRCRTCRQHPPGVRRRRFTKLGTCPQIFFGDTYQGGHRGKHYRYKQATWLKNGGKSFSEIFSGPCGAKNPGIIIPLQRLSPNQQIAVQHYQLLE
jgi:hypothetical protein